MTNILVVSLLFALLAVMLLLWGLFLRLGLRWARVEGVSIRRIAFATVFVYAMQMAIVIGASFLSPPDITTTWIDAVAGSVVLVIVQCLIVAVVFRIPPWRSFRAWVPTLLTPVILAPFAVFVIHPYLAEAFTSPTNAMAPTLIGKHVVGVCDTCGGPEFCSPAKIEFSRRESPLMICRDEFHVARSARHGSDAVDADCFLVAKFVEPQRWDIVAFRYPEDPSILYCMRLVGLPGEEIVIRDGHVWADGQELNPPASIAGIEYLSEMPGWDRALWGSEEEPAKLAADEYFVLGDFSARSKDSRWWERGALGHNPYAVPESHLYGVVSTIYWPLARWRGLR